MDVVALVVAVHHVASVFVAVAFMEDHHEAVVATVKEAVIEVRRHEVSLEDAIKYRSWWFWTLARLVLKHSCDCSPCLYLTFPYVFLCYKVLNCAFMVSCSLKRIRHQSLKSTCNSRRL